MTTIPLSASAQSTWLGANANWSTASNWNPAALPAADANIIVNDTTVAGLTLNDGSHSVGSILIGNTGNRITGFTVQTNAANTLTIKGGVTASGNFTTGIGTRFRGNTVIANEQTWQVGGAAGTHAEDRGIAINDVGSGNVIGTLALNADLNKSGTGQLTMGALTVTGVGNINVNEGSLKLNAGGSLPLTMAKANGAGKITVNNSALLILSKNSGSFALSRDIEFRNTSNLMTGSGSNTAPGTWEIASNVGWVGTAHTITNNQDANNTSLVHYRMTGVMSGSANLTKTGASNLILAGAGANTHTGNITVNQGALVLDKTGALAVNGNITVAGTGTLTVNQAEQIADTSSITVTGGAIGFTANRAETIASLTIGSPIISSVSGFTVTGATSITSGTHQINSAHTFTTNSLSIANGTLQFVGNGTPPETSIANVGAGGLTLNNAKIEYGNPGANGGNTTTSRVNLSGDLVSTGASRFETVNNAGARILDLQGASRAFAVNGGTLEIRPATENGTNNGPSIENGSVVKTGEGTLVLSRSNSTANFSFNEGPVRLKSEVGAGNVTHAAGPLHMDIGGTSPAKLTASGDFTSTGGTIELTAVEDVTFTGNKELVRYHGTLTGTPVINIPAALQNSRMAPVVDYGTGTDSAITISSAALPLPLTWTGTFGSVWDIASASNFANAGAQNFYDLDSVTFNDTASGSSIVLNSTVTPKDVVFDHGVTVPTFTLTGTGAITGPTKLTKNGTGTTIIATDNSYTGATDILGGTLQVGNGGLTGSLGTGAVQVAAGATLKFARGGYAVVGNTITGAGTLENSGPGTAALTANSDAFTGTVVVSGGTLQIGDGGTTGSLGTLPVSIAAGATFAVKRSETPTISNVLSGAGSLAIVGGSPILNAATVNLHTGGVSVTEGGVLRVPADTTLGEVPADLIPNAIRLDHGGLKNQDTNTVISANRGIAITGEAYFTAGWSKKLTIDGPITGTGNVFINRDSGPVYFSNTASDWNGVLTLGGNRPGFNGETGGVLEITSINNGGVAGPLGKSSAAPGNIVFTGGTLLYSAANIATTDRGFTLEGSGTVNVSAADAALAFSGQVTGPGSLTKTGPGKLTLSGASDFAGEKVIADGTLEVKSTTALGGTGAPVRFTGTAGVLDLATSSSVSPYPVTIGAAASGRILANMAAPGAGIHHTLGQADLAAVTLNVAAGANVTGGDPRVVFSGLSLTAEAAGATILNPTTANISVGGPVSITAGNFAKGLTLGGTGLNSEVTGSIGNGLNTLSLTKANNSLWTLSGDNTFTGNVTVDDGTLVLAHGNALGDPAKTVIVAGDDAQARTPELRLTGGISATVATIQVSGMGMDQTSGAIRNYSGDNTLNATTQVTMRTGNGGTTLYSDSGTLTLNTPLLTSNASNRALTLAGAGNGVINGVIANGSTANLPVSKNGTGTWTLNGASTYSGATLVNQGVLSLNQASLSDTAAVGISTGGVLNLNFSGTDRVGSLIINGEFRPDGVYNASNEPGFITGTGSIRVGAEPSGYGTWAAGYPFTAGVDDGVDQDPDGDGISNLMEYVLGGVPVGAGASDRSILPTHAVTADSLVLTFRRSDASENDVTLKVQWSSDLGTWNDFATIGAGDALPAVDVTEDSPTAGLDTVVVTVPKSLSTTGKLFVRLHAVK
ncbi:autotransporter-associated beta strand repeat-containing protein [Luteolibacter flavescens]|uniref:Autotransporter-associated beta strand repeat-containing protein n=1 Tax=Luteolibacter flavescens TaxID=1859460 RepID=A0ABT3FPR9_9BACT|nr:autotransporter-associated beta strand repeat-containing protein [Luteolibacter flavescens]MCW1885246.1 autotransporter-associated beta strand repeat-containing protein [Luteolibacter flavescens]